MKIFKRLLVAVLSFEARLILAKYRPFIIAITGSVGKTSTKDAIYAVVKNQSSYVRKSEKSLNSEIGLPLTVIGVPNAWRDIRGWFRNISFGLKLILKKMPYPDTLVVEVGADHPNDIRKVTRWLKPDIAVLTKVSDKPVHVEFFASPEQVFEEKKYLIKAVRKGGTAVLFDDQKNLALADEIKKEEKKVVFFGTTPSTYIRGENFAFEFIRDNGAVAGGLPVETINKTLVCKFDLHIGTESRTVHFRSPIGRTGMYMLLAAAAVGFVRDMKIDEIVSSLKSYEAPNGRMNMLTGVNNTMILDDSYNSSPDAVEAALLTLKELTCSGKKIAVLGDMMELGKYSAEEHRRIGQICSKVVDLLVTVGPRSRTTGEEARRNGLSEQNVLAFDTALEAADAVRRLVKNGDIVLIKGSQSMRMERVTKELLADRSRASEVLVRQEREWLEKA